MKRTNTTVRTARPFDVPARVLEHRRGQLRRALDVGGALGVWLLVTLTLGWTFAGKGGAGALGIIDWAGLAFGAFLLLAFVLGLWGAYADYPRARR